MNKSNVSSFEQFRKLIKRDLGAGYERVVYLVFENEKMRLRSFMPGEKPDCEYKSDCQFGILKSWRDYTKRERKETIDRLISTMIQAGVNSLKFEEILAGLKKPEMEDVKCVV